MGKRKSMLRKAAPLCLAAVLASTGTLAVTQPDMAHILSTAGLFGDIDGDGSVGASDAAEILMYAAWSGAGNTGDLAYFEQLSGNAVTETTEAPAETTEAPAETTEAPSETTEAPAETTEPAAEDNYDYGFYDVLSAEWAKTGDTSTYRITPAGDSGKNAVMQNGKIAFYSSVGGKTTLGSYDINTKELTTREIEGTPSTMFFSNGDFYAITVNFVSLSFSYSLTKYDMNGGEDHTLTNVGNLGLADIMTTATGYVMIPDINMYLTPTFETRTLPELVTKDSHGLDTTVADLETIGTYGDNFYLQGKNSVDSTYALYCFNVVTEEWTKVLDLSGSILSTSGTASKCIGRYLLFAHDKSSIRNTDFCTIFDMETNTVYADDVPKASQEYQFHDYYYGGKRLIIPSYYGGEIRAFTPARGTIITETYLSMEKTAEVICTETTKTGSGVTVLDDNYYLYFDSAGLFLRKYETGAEQEDIVFLFPQS